MKESKLLGQILVQIGATPLDVAANLRACGIKGVRNTVRHLNPIVRFVEYQLRLDDYGLDVMHGDGMPTYILRLTLPDGKEAETPFPEPVRAFLDAF